MAKMIPARINDDNPSTAEKRVFDMLKSADGTNDWTVLHSLGLSGTAKGPYGEIDFVVIIPGVGIICLEVKGGRVSCENGQWKTMNRAGNVSPLNKSPFTQAREAMFALRDAIINHFGNRDESKCPITCGVVFSDVACPPITPEFERWEVIDHHDLREPIEKHVMKIARNWLQRFRSHRNSRLPTYPQARAISNFLRPDFDRIVSKTVTMERIEERLIGLTEEQYARLDELEDNPRCLFRGAAGTGKTLLAVEYARRASLNGDKVLLVCFNRLLSNWLREQTQGTGIVADTWHEIARRFILESSIGDDFRKEMHRAFESTDPDSLRKLFEETWHEYAGLALSEHIERNGRSFDRLVLDEAQDILGDENVVEFLDLALKDGLSHGNWAIFGDFSPQQALFDDLVNPVEILENYTDYFVRSSLTLNCRNTQQIANAISAIAGGDNSRCRMDAETGLPVERRYYKTPAGLVRALTNTIERLVKNDKVPIEDIVILAPHRLDNTALAGIDLISGYPIADITNRDLKMEQSSIKFSTIQAFKGLDSPVAIIVDIDESDSDWMKSVLYVGMSRARSLLILMIGENARK